MRITDFPMMEEVKDEYLKLRQDGNNRADATQALIHNYMNEITTGAEDDGLLFWVALADVQYSRKELTEEVARRGISALNQIENTDWGITVGDIERRRKHYASAPMSERKVGKPRPKFRCEWKNGDTFAYKLKGPDAERYGIAGKFFLFRKVDAYDFGDGYLDPVVTVSFWEKEPFPKNADEFSAVPLLKIRNGGRCGSPKDKFEYRAEITARSKKQLESLSLRYIGNFQDTPMPEDEIIFTYPGYTKMIIPECIDRDCSIFWKMHVYCTQGIILQ